jgi:hypothetical protein
MNMEIPNEEMMPSLEVHQLERRLTELGIDMNETEKIVEEAVLMFGEGRPEHEVEAIVEAFFNKIAQADE